MSLGSFESGDLGLGYGLKPGSLITPDLFNNDNFTFSSDHGKYAGASTTDSSVGTNEQIDCKLADVELKNGELKSKISEKYDKPQENKKYGFLSNKNKCNHFLEIDSLKNELESVRQQLTSKQQGIKILQQELKISKSENEQLRSKLKWLQDILIKDFNSLQFNVARERLVMTENKEFYQSQIDNLEKEKELLNSIIKKQLEKLKDFQDSKIMNDADVSDINSNNTNSILVVDFESGNKTANVFDCDCYCFDYKRCACAKAADKLFQQIKILKSELSTYSKAYRDETSSSSPPPSSSSSPPSSSSPSSPLQNKSGKGKTSPKIISSVSLPLKEERTFKKIIHECINVRSKS